MKVVTAGSIPPGQAAGCKPVEVGSIPTGVSGGEHQNGAELPSAVADPFRFQSTSRILVGRVGQEFRPLPGSLYHPPVENTRRRDSPEGATVEKTVSPERAFATPVLRRVER